MYGREGDRLHANEDSGSLVLLTQESWPSELPATRQKSIELKCCEDMQNLDPSFLSLRSPHLGALDNNFISVKVCRPFPVPLPSQVTVRNWPSELRAKTQKVMKFACGEDIGKLDPSFSSPCSPQSGVVDNDFTSVEVTDPGHQDRLLSETAMTKLPSPTMNIKRNKQEQIAQTTPSTKVFECKICHKKFPTFQALGGHTTGHMKRRPATQLGGITSLTQPWAVARRHECSICGKCFPSGQALGGHMTLHRNNDVGKMKDAR